MKVVIIGGSGLIGKKLAGLLQQAGHDVTAASPSSGVNSVTGEGLDAALAGAQVVVDVSNSPSFEDTAVLNFFKASAQNLATAEAKAGVRHHVALSVVGADRVPDSGYLRAKVAQESIIRSAGVPYTIVRATQFFEFMNAIAYTNTEGQNVRLPSAPLQPIAATDVAAALADVVNANKPLNGICDIAGPEAVPLDDLIRRVFKTNPQETRTVVTDENATYFGSKLDQRSLVPLGEARIGKISLEQWLAMAA